MPRHDRRRSGRIAAFGDSRIVEAGDIDNLGYGWPAGFDVFSGNPTPSQHTLALGYTVTLRGKVFDDGRTTRSFTLYRFKGRPDRPEVSKCVPVQGLVP